MKTLLLLLLLFLRLPAGASQIVVGLHSEHLVSWGVWERQGSSLKHYLLLYNKAPTALDIQIKQRRFRAVGTSFEDVKTDKTLLRVRVAAHQLVRVRYPKSRSGNDYMAYFENGRAIGLTLFNPARPTALALLGPGNRFYANEGLNGSLPTSWMGFESIYAPPAQIDVTAASRNFGGGYHLVKLFASPEAARQQAGRLDSLAAGDAAVLRLDSAHRRTAVPVPAGWASSGLAVWALLTERLEFSTRYDDRRPVREKSLVSSEVCLIPIFPRRPE